MEPLIRGENLTKIYWKGGRFGGRREPVQAVKDLSLEVQPGQSLGLIGESGCGKSTLGRMLCRLTTVESGRLFYRGREMTGLSRKQLRPFRAHIQMIFQNSLSAFDPSYTIGQSMDEVLKNLSHIPSAGYRELEEEMLNAMALSPELLDRYPRDLSGGERQRANIARSMIIRPELVICDEVVASLDYSLRKSVLELLRAQEEEAGITYLFITHDLSTIQFVCSRVAVMYCGRIVETMDVDHLQERMLHPYTKLLFRSVLIADPARRGTIGRLQFSEPPSVRQVQGCAFSSRCDRCTERCRRESPVLRTVEVGHQVACHCV